MKELGLQLIDGHRAQELFHDPRRSDGALIFVDARDAGRYREGHIPGAYEFDPYHPKQYLDAVLPVCQKAGLIVVYCNGGDCDDSESAALSLRDDGIASQKLLIYAGGMTEWTTNGWPIEKDGRNFGGTSYASPHSITNNFGGTSYASPHNTTNGKDPVAPAQ